MSLVDNKMRTKRAKKEVAKTNARSEANSIPAESLSNIHRGLVCQGEGPVCYNKDSCFSVSVVDASINVYTNSAHVKDKFRNSVANFPVLGVIPGYTFHDKLLEECRYALEYDKDGNGIKFGDKNIYMGCEEEGLYFNDLVTGILILLEKQHQSQNKFTMHCSAFGRDGRSCLLLGDTGNGKTTTLLNLSLRGYSMFSNDRTVVGYHEENLAIFAGTKYLSIRPHIYEKLLHKERSFLDSTRCGFTEKGKIILDLEMERNKEILPSITKISNILFIQILDDTDTKLFATMGDREGTLSLTNELSASIRGVRQVSISHKEQFPSYDDETLTKNRNLFIRSILSNMQLYVLKANLRNLTNAIIDIFEGKGIKTNV
jgi:hypothetical protein